jgi:hypothetical protein
MSWQVRTGVQERKTKTRSLIVWLGIHSTQTGQEVANVNEKEQAAKLRIPTWRRIAHQGAAL